MKPKRTRRMIECIIRQNFTGFELFIVGDKCPHLHHLMNYDWLHFIVRGLTAKGNKVYVDNSLKHFGGYGYYQRNAGIRKATGKYTIFLDNDDVILDNHFEHYYNGIAGTDLDFAYFNTWVEPNNTIRMAQLMQGSIGHSEIIVRTEYLKQMPNQTTEYGHDWKLIQALAAGSGKHKRIEGEECTYRIMSVAGKTNDTID